MAIVLAAAIAFLFINEKLGMIEGLRLANLYAYLGLNGEIVSDSDFCVWFLDVGQGECSVIKTPDGAVLIDSGEYEYAEEVISLLKRLGVTKLDYCIVSHSHTDHSGGMPEILRSFGADIFLCSKADREYADQSETTKEIYKAAEKYCGSIIAVERGYHFDLGETEFTVLSPGCDYEELNDSSLVIRMTYSNVSFLFTGDVESSAEEEMLTNCRTLLSSDILKVHHHGSQTSSSESFIAAVKPKVAVISCGKDNEYGHPHLVVLKTLFEYGAEIYRTDLQGTVMIEVDTDGVYSVRTNKAKSAA